MLIKEFKGYQEGRDITKIDPDFFTYPSKNVLVYKGKAYKRPGIALFGAAQDQEKPIHGEYVWKDAAPGEMPIRTFDQTVQVWLEEYKTGAGWTDIYAALNAGTQRVRFATWIDSNDSIIHKRIFFVDGSTNVYQWNGAVGVVASVASSTITLATGKTAEALGFDDGSVTAQTVIINGTEYTYDNDPTGQDLTLTSTPSGVSAGDLVIAKPTVATTLVTGLPNKDHIHTYKNHVMLGSLDSVACYFSHIADYPLNFTVPGTKTAATAFFITLDGNLTASTERKGILWLSTQDDWFKTIKLDSANAFGLFVEVSKDESTERNGALPYAVSNFRGDTIFVAQDKTIQMITDLELIQSDSIKLLSDEVVGLLQRTNMTNVRVVVHERYIYIICPADATTIMYDTVDGFWQTPQEIGMSLLSIIGGQLIGHSNARNESFYLFSGNQDLGVDFEAVFAFPYRDNEDEFEYKQFSKQGISGRAKESAHVIWETFYDTDGEKRTHKREFDMTNVRMYASPVDSTWGALPFATAPYGGAIPATGSELKRFFLFDAPKATEYFECSTKITVSGESAEFHLLAYKTYESKASRKVGNDHYLPA